MTWIGPEEDEDLVSVILPTEGMCELSFMSSQVDTVKNNLCIMYVIVINCI